MLTIPPSMFITSGSNLRAGDYFHSCAPALATCSRYPETPLSLFLPTYCYSVCFLCPPFAKERGTKPREQSSFLPALDLGEFCSPRSLRESPLGSAKIRPTLLFACILVEVSAGCPVQSALHMVVVVGMLYLPPHGPPPHLRNKRCD